MCATIRTILAAVGIVFCASLLGGCGRPGIEVVKTLTSPDGDWTISHEFDRRWGQHIVVLRHKSGHEVMRWLSQEMVDEPTDYEPEIAITNDTAGFVDRAMWQLDTKSRRWHSVDDSGTKRLD